MGIAVTVNWFWQFFYFAENKFY